MVSNDGLNNEPSCEVDSLPFLSDVQTAPPSPSSFKDCSMELDILDFEDELLGPAFEVAPSLSVCGNIHQARFFPFWEDVLKCGPWHKNILKEGLKLDFIDGILPEPYEERNNKSARLEPAFVCDSLDSMSSANVLEPLTEKPVCVNPLTVASRELAQGSRKLRLCWDGSRYINPKLKKLSVKLTHFTKACLLYTSPSPRDRQKSRMPSSA